ncbi:MAG: hypothetical protein VKO21_01525 [Candidatus Sericytochromatia bacterium]|nr:hypothetical protein [Candidatus Sericytochromatia bacterium]
MSPVMMPTPAEIDTLLAPAMLARAGFDEAPQTTCAEEEFLPAEEARPVRELRQTLTYHWY